MGDESLERHKPCSNSALKLILALAEPDMPAEFSNDRGRLYFGPGFEFCRNT